MPDETPMVAIEVDALLHDPPMVASVKLAVEFRQTLDGPDIVAGVAGLAMIVMFVVV